MTVNWTNPYAAGGNVWLKGNLHSHSQPISACSGISLEALVAAYHANGYDFLCVSDHMHITHPQGHGMVLLPGFEWNAKDPDAPGERVNRRYHMGVHALDGSVLESCLLAREPERLFPLAEHTLLVANHPNWLLPEHYDLESLHACAEGIHGLEIHNALIDRLEGEADATAKWDRLLSVGRPLLGFASDDSHLAGDIGKGWVMVRAERSVGGVFAALKSGNFYCSTGVVIRDIGRRDQRLYLTLAEEARVRAIGYGGKVLATQVCRETEWDFSWCDSAYVRFHICDSRWRQAWSQPFFASDPEQS